MRIYKTTNVFEEALNRFRFLYDEFDEVFITVSGGKDSTVIFELAKIVAGEKNKLPIKVMFIDQEAEYESTIDMIRYMMYDPDVEPYWLQVPIRIFNATSKRDEWLWCWREGDKWMREKDPISIKENRWGTDRFHDMFVHFLADRAVEGKIVCDVGGVRAEESPGRFLGLTGTETYKGITWGRKNYLKKNAFTFYPIYDWTYIDVWKAIHDNGWRYNAIYDAQYSYGVPVMEMRVSNLHHETSIHALFMLQELEPDTYEKLTARLAGADTAGKLGKEDYFVKELPFMFKDWREYRDYLLENLIDEDKRPIFRKQFDATEHYLVCIPPEKIYKTHIQSILANDWHGTKLGNARAIWDLAMKDYKRSLAKKCKN